MSRNVFENNAQEVPLTELARLEGKLYTILPELQEGQYYKIETLSNGRVAIVVEKN